MTMHAHWRGALALAALCAALILPWPPARADEPDEPSYKVVVNPSNRTRKVSKKFLARAFLKKSVRWGNGLRLRPADLGSRSRTRREFTEDILSRSVTAVRTYWQQAIFSGRDVPPPELKSDAAVIRYVMRYKGAIGYISDDADAGPAVVIEVR